MKISQNHKAISPSAVAAVLLVVGLAIGAGAGYLYSSSTSGGATKTITTGGTTVTSTVAAGPVTYTIGSIQPITGSLASFGVSFQNSVDLAVKQMNANLSAVGSNVQFKVVHADDQQTPGGALQALTSEFTSQGVQVVIGPLTSAEVQGVTQYATQNHIVVLPGAATATALIGVSPYLYRPGQPGDQFEGTVIAQSVIQTGGKNVVYLYRNDISEYGTFNASMKIMLAAGLKVQGIALAPGQSDYAAQVQSAGTAVAQYLSGGGTAKNTVVVLGDHGTDAQNVFQHGATDTNLQKVRWYGIEALDDQALLGSSVAAFMAHSNLTIAAPSALASPQFSYFNKTYTAEYGKPPQPFSGYFYDNAWIAMLSILAAGNNGQAIAKVLPIVADHFFGSSSTGIWLVNHDQSIALYDVLKCVQSGGKYTFIKIGSYDGGTNQLALG